MSLAQTLATLPTTPGVYLMKDADDTVLYVGKAVALRNRVRSYFQPGQDLTPRIRMMVGRVAAIDTIVTGSEVEALILEANLIKEHLPRYNVRLRDDKRFPYLKLTDERFPQLIECRQTARDGARYFGPFTDAGAMRRVDRLLRRLFKIRSCTFDLTGEAQMRPCLDHHIGLCDAPCAALVSQETYRAGCEQAAAFLRGEVHDIPERLAAGMQHAAQHLEFERAAELRDLLADVQKVIERQRVVSNRRLDADAVALARHDDVTCVQVLFIRGGKVIGDHHGIVENTAEKTADEPLRAFLIGYYEEAAEIPRAVLLSNPLEDAEVIADWLAAKTDHKVEVSVPERGELYRLVGLAATNAEVSLNAWLADRDRQKQRGEQAVSDLREQLGLTKTPFRIECFDIATLQGDQSVGSMVVFEDGRALKNAYRQFKVKQPADAPNDYAMMREVLTRRLQRAVDGDAKFLPLPDLLVVDGGKGQLQVAVEVTTELGLQQLPLAALAKRFEQVFRPGRADPIIMPERAAGLRVLRALRDEAHRFANTYHRRLRRNEGLHSILDDIPGVGPKRRTLLLSHFRSTKAIREASLEELAALPGMNLPAAEAVKKFLTEGAPPPDGE